jgi:hypothetical protein
MQASRLLSRTKDTATSGIDLYRLPMCQTQRHRQRLDREAARARMVLMVHEAVDAVPVNAQDCMGISDRSRGAVLI